LSSAEGSALDRVWYHVFPLGALEAPRLNPAPGDAGSPVDHRLRGLIDQLDRVAELGAGGMLLGPVFESESHGYDTVDPFRIDPRLGDEGDLVALAEGCRQRGIRLALDGVFHHVGRSHPAFQQVLQEGPGSAGADWFHIDPTADSPDGFGYADFEGHRQLVKLNHANPAVAQWAAEVVRHWQDRGVGGWRIDAAYAIPRPFLAGLCDAGRAHRPDTFFVGEVIHGDYAGFARDAHLDAVTQYELWKAIWSSINDRNLFELAWALKRHGEHCRSTRLWNFVGNHDTTRIASQLSDPRHVGHAVAVLFVVPGTPAVYAGDETAAQGIKRHEEWGDDDVRRPAPPVPAEGAGRSAWELHQRLIGVRNRLAWLSTAQVSMEGLANEEAVIAVEGEDGVARLALNLSDRTTAAPAGEVLAGAEGDTVAPHEWSLRLAPR